MNKANDRNVAALDAVLADIGDLAVAVSGGVDSMTLGFLAHRALPGRITMFHAASPAVPPEAGARVRDYAKRYAWSLEVISAGEFTDPDYRRNPVNRCFYCKTNLYGTIARQCATTIASGTNLDDLGDYRPGLSAAKQYGVRHPWVEAGIGKQAIREIARSHGLDDLAVLPAAPCLSSRLETGIAVSAPALEFVHRIERLVAARIEPQTVRCRVRHAGTAVELDPVGLAQLRSERGRELRADIAQLSEDYGYGAEVCFEPYRMGSAFRRS